MDVTAVVTFIQALSVPVSAIAGAMLIIHFSIKGWKKLSSAG